MYKEDKPITDISLHVQKWLTSSYTLLLCFVSPSTIFQPCQDVGLNLYEAEDIICINCQHLAQCVHKYFKHHKAWRIVQSLWFERKKIIFVPAHEIFVLLAYATKVAFK